MQTHVGASGILRIDGRYLLGRRVKDDPALPGQWCTPGGGVEIGESIEDCIQREFKEETGLDVKTGSLSFRPFISIQQRTSDKRTFLVFMSVVLKHRGQVSDALDGFDSVGYFSFSEIINGLNVTDMTKAAITEYEEVVRILIS